MSERGDSMAMAVPTTRQLGERQPWVGRASSFLPGSKCWNNISQGWGQARLSASPILLLQCQQGTSFNSSRLPINLLGAQFTLESPQNSLAGSLGFCDLFFFLKDFQFCSIQRQEKRNCFMKCFIETCDKLFLLLFLWLFCQNNC